MAFIHKNLASGKWQKLSLAEQMGNIGSEVSRALHWRQAGDRKGAQKSAWRALELIDLTLADKRWQGRTFELGRLREVFCDMFFGKKSYYNVSPQSLQNYFLPFAFLAQKQSIKVQPQ